MTKGNGAHLGFACKDFAKIRDSFVHDFIKMVSRIGAHSSSEGTFWADDYTL